LRGGVWLICSGRHAFQSVLKIARGKLILRVVAGDGDKGLVRQLGGLSKIRFARRGKQGKLGLRAAGRCTGKKCGQAHAGQRE
jgi:hypothetical protein